MPSDPTASEPDPSQSEETFRLPDENLDDLAASLRATVAEVRRHGVLLDRLDTEPALSAEPEADPDTATAAPGIGDAELEQKEQGPASVFILALDDAAYAVELAALTNWVEQLLLPSYGREISTTRPWCDQWHEHPEAVGRLHALWLAWQQLTDVEAGLSGPSTWHRDHLDPALLQVRAPDGPFAACTTSPSRPNHRVLAAPGPVQNGAGS